MINKNKHPLLWYFDKSHHVYRYVCLCACVCVFVYSSVQEYTYVHVTLHVNRAQLLDWALVGLGPVYM